MVWMKKLRSCLHLERWRMVEPSSLIQFKTRKHYWYTEQEMSYGNASNERSSLGKRSMTNKKIGIRAERKSTV